MTTYTVNTTDDIVDGNFTQLSLREALALADSDPATADTIEFAPEVQGGRIVLAGSELTVNSDVTIDGGSGVTLDADEKSRVLLVQGDETGVTLAHLTFTGGRTAGFGGGISASGFYASVTLDDVTVTGNRSAGGGGVRSYFVTLTNSTVSDNRAIGGGGGGISGSYVFLSDSTVSGNRATESGGGIFGDRGVGLDNSTVSGNSTTSARFC